MFDICSNTFHQQTLKHFDQRRHTSYTTQRYLLDMARNVQHKMSEVLKASQQERNQTFANGRMKAKQNMLWKSKGHHQRRNAKQLP